MVHSRNITIVVYELLLIVELLIFRGFVDGAMTMSQMEKTMETMRSICGPKYKLTDEIIEGLKKGKFVEDNKDLKCYTLCISQMAGTLSKKNEISAQKTLGQIENFFPAEVKEHLLKVFDACKDVQKGYKEPCDRTFYTTKCMYEFSPEKFMYP